MNPKDLVGAKKAPLDLIPPAAIIAMAEAFGNGATKYGPYNWREQPIQVRTYIGAAMRHLLAFQDGQWAAEDTGISHLAHAMAGIGILIDAFATGAVIDNRVEGPAAGMLRAQDKSVNPGDLELMRDDGKPRISYMGIDLGVWVRAMETPPDELFYFKSEELLELKLATGVSGAKTGKAGA